MTERLAFLSKPTAKIQARRRRRKAQQVWVVGSTKAAMRARVTTSPSRRGFLFFFWGGGVWGFFGGCFFFLSLGGVGVGGLFWGVVTPSSRTMPIASCCSTHGSPNGEHAKQREARASATKKAEAARNDRKQPARQLGTNGAPERRSRHHARKRVSPPDGSDRVDMTPESTTHLKIGPHLDISADGKSALVAWRTQRPGPRGDNR